MDKLLDSIAVLVSLVSPEKVQAIASRIRQIDADKAAAILQGVVGTPTASAVVDQLAVAWLNSSVGSDELASMLLAASYTYNQTVSAQSTELVWTGPTTPFVSARRTEQALLQVINSAEQTLYITSFVAYDVDVIVAALNNAAKRGVDIHMILELAQFEGGSTSFDSLGTMKRLVPAAKVYAWRYRNDHFSGGKVHAKVAVADDRVCFVTSANLTGHAMEKNMEAGVLINGSFSATLYNHLASLVSTNTVTEL